MAHDPLHVAFRRTQELMVVVTHQTVCMPLGTESRVGIAQKGEKVEPLGIGIEHHPPSGAPVHHVMPGTWILDA